MTRDEGGATRPGEAGRVVYLMRGLPCCGKSTAARELAGASGVVCETDAYFHTEVGDDPTRYDYRADLLGAARDWNFARFRAAVDAGISPVVVDRGNSLSAESRDYARYALERGYRVELREPETPWWREIRELLRDQARHREELGRWALRLAAMSREGHRVPARTILRWMAWWRTDLTVEDILAYEPEPTPSEPELEPQPAGPEAAATFVIHAGPGGGAAGR